MKAFSCGLSRSIRLRHAWVSSTGETFFVLTRADARSMLRNASASDEGANLGSAPVLAASFAPACDPIIAPTTAANDASRNILRVKIVPPSGSAGTGDAFATYLRELVIGMPHVDVINNVGHSHLRLAYVELPYRCLPPVALYRDGARLHLTDRSPRGAV